MSLLNIFPEYGFYDQIVISWKKELKVENPTYKPCCFTKKGDGYLLLTT